MKLKYTYIFLFVFIFTGFAVFNSITTYKTAKRSSEDLLNSTAYFIGITLDQALNRIGIDEELFLDVIRSQPWEEIAFIALYDKDGKILLHSSKRLIGKSSNDPNITDLIKRTEPVSSYLELKTGETVYVMDLPIHIHNLFPTVHLLRIALHTYPSQKTVLHAKVHNITASIVVCFLWILAFTFYRYSRKIDDLQRREIEKRHFTMLGEMAAVLAHEIRSPLSAIKGFAQYINEGKDKTSSAEEGLGVIISESQRLERLTEDLLIYARAGEVVTVNFSLAELIEEVDGLFIIDGKAVKIKKDLLIKDDTLNTDREKLKQILINILQNSIDSIDGKGTVEIKLSGNGDVIHILIKDSGKGMDNETIRSASKPFFTTKTKGTGLGLAIVDNLLKTLHGSLKIESEPDRGTMVTISLQRTLR